MDVFPDVCPSRCKLIDKLTGWEGCKLSDDDIYYQNGHSHYDIVIFIHVFFLI